MRFEMLQQPLLAFGRRGFQGILALHTTLPLELRQSKSHSTESRSMFVLKLPRFFPHSISEWKSLPISKQKYISVTTCILTRTEIGRFGAFFPSKESWVEIGTSSPSIWKDLINIANVYLLARPAKVQLHRNFVLSGKPNFPLLRSSTVSHLTSSSLATGSNATNNQVLWIIRVMNGLSLEVLVFQNEHKIEWW